MGLSLNYVEATVYDPYKFLKFCMTVVYVGGGGYKISQNMSTWFMHNPLQNWKEQQKWNEEVEEMMQSWAKTRLTQWQTNPCRESRETEKEREKGQISGVSWVV